MDGIGGGRIAVPPVPDNPETGLIGGMMPGAWLEVAGGCGLVRSGFPPICS